MNLETSGAHPGANQDARLAAAEEPALASNKFRHNGIDRNDPMVAIPSRGQRKWAMVAVEWKWIATMLSPFVLAIALYFIPATKGELETVKKDAAGSLEVAKATLTGQNEAVKVKIDALQALIAETRNDVKEMRGDLKAVLQHIPNRTDPPAAAIPVAPIPAAIPPKERKVRVKPPAQSSFWMFPH